MSSISMTSKEFTTSLVVPKVSLTSEIGQATRGVLPTSIVQTIADYASAIPSQDGFVTDGYGEFIVFNKKGKEVSEKTYDACYEIFNRFSPQNLEKPLADRVKAIRETIQKINPDLDICFIPRTLLELSLIHQVVQEEIDNRNGNYPMCWKLKESMLKTAQSPLKDKMCWHAFDCEDGDKERNNDPRIKKIAFELNKILINDLHPTEKGLSRDTISQLATKELDYLKNLYQDFEKRKYGRGGEMTASVFGPTHPALISYRIDDPKNRAVILKAIDIECSEAAKRSVILYRGGDFEKDEAYKLSVEKEGLPTRRPYSVSFGTGPFAGTVHDPDASAARNWFAEKDDKYRDAYLFLLPIGQKWKQGFYVPESNAVAQFYGYGDAFHARSKVSTEQFKQGVSGLSYQNEHTEKYAKDHFQTSLSIEETEQAFHVCKCRHGVLLRKAEEITS